MSRINKELTKILKTLIDVNPNQEDNGRVESGYASGRSVSTGDPPDRSTLVVI